MSRPRLRPGDRLWTYAQIAELVGCVPGTVATKCRKLGIPTYRKPQSHLRQVFQYDVERLVARWLITVPLKAKRKNGDAKG